MTKRRSPADEGNFSDGSADRAGTSTVHAHADAPTRTHAVPNVPPGDLAAIYRAHHPTVWRVLRGLGVPRGMVDDAAQDVFVVVQRRLHTYDGRVALRRWILGIARNVGKRSRDKAARKQARTDALEVEPAATRVPEPDDALAQREASHFVDTFFDSLRPDKRAVFTMIDIEGLSAVEAAELLKISYAARGDESRSRPPPCTQARVAVGTSLAAPLAFL